MHTSFHLNNRSFENSNDLMNYASELSEDLYSFLEEWFQDSPTVTIQTSGSTGIPTSITIRKAQMRNSALATGTYFDLKPESKVLCCLSVNYIAGKMMVVRALELGWHLDFVNPIANPLENNNTIYDFVAMVPMQVQASLHHLSQVKKLLIGGAAISFTLNQSLQNLSTQCFASYGMTETVSHIAIQRLNFCVSDLDNALYELLPGITIGLDERGCLVIDAPTIADDMVVTNDLVMIVDEKRFKWLGRVDNVINSGGVKIHAELLEQKMSPYLETPFFVTGVADERLGEKMVMIVEGEFVEIDFQSMNLLKYEIPKAVFFVPEMVYTATKKIQRKQTLDLVLLKQK